MKIENRKSVCDMLSKYNIASNENDYIEITEWTNGEGFDITIYRKGTGEHMINLSRGEIDAINYLTKALEIEEVE